MKLTYWRIPCEDDARCYSFRARTRKEVKAQLADYLAKGGQRSSFGEVQKVVVEYKDAFDLAERLLTEGSEDNYLAS